MNFTHYRKLDWQLTNSQLPKIVAKLLK